LLVYSSLLCTSPLRLELIMSGGRYYHHPPPAPPVHAHSASAPGGGAPPASVTWRQMDGHVKALAEGALADEAAHLAYSPFGAQDAAMVLSERLMIALRELTGSAFKLIIHVAVLQRGAGLHTTSATWWDSVHDGLTTARFENASVVVIASIWGVRLD